MGACFVHRLTVLAACLFCVVPAAAIISCAIEVPDTACRKAGAYTVYPDCNNVMQADPNCPSVRTAYLGETGYNSYITYSASCVYWTYTPTPWLDPPCSVTGLINSPSVSCDAAVLQSYGCSGSGAPPS
jgi:hypothetical protein